MLEQGMRDTIRNSVLTHAGEKLTAEEQQLLIKAVGRDVELVVTHQVILSQTQSELMYTLYYLGSKYFNQKLLSSRDFILEQLGVFFDASGMTDRHKKMLLLALQSLALDDFFLTVPLLQKTGMIQSVLEYFIGRFTALTDARTDIAKQAQDFSLVLSQAFEPTFLLGISLSIQGDTAHFFNEIFQDADKLDAMQVTAHNYSLVIFNMHQSIQYEFQQRINASLRALKQGFADGIVENESIYDAAKRFWQLLHDKKFSRIEVHLIAKEISRRHAAPLLGDLQMPSYAWECFHEELAELFFNHQQNAIGALFSEQLQLDEENHRELRARERTPYLLRLVLLAEILRAHPNMILALQRIHAEMLCVDWEHVKAAHIFFNVLTHLPARLHALFFRLVDNPDMNVVDFLSEINSILGDTAVMVSPLVLGILDDPDFIPLFERLAENYAQKEKRMTEHVLQLSKDFPVRDVCNNANQSDFQRPSMG